MGLQDLEQKFSKVIIETKNISSARTAENGLCSRRVWNDVCSVAMNAGWNGGALIQRWSIRRRCTTLYVVTAESRSLHMATAAGNIAVMSAILRIDLDAAKKLNHEAAGHRKMTVPENAWSHVYCSIYCTIYSFIGGVINGAISGEINETINQSSLREYEDCKSPEPTSSMRLAPGDFLFSTVCEYDLTFQAFRVIYRQTCR